MTPHDKINLYTANRQGLISREERDARLAAGDLIEAYAYPHPSGKVAWGVNSLITGFNTKRGIVE